MDIRVDDLSGAEISGLIREHLRGMARESPPESMHALGLETGSTAAFAPARLGAAGS